MAAPDAGVGEGAPTLEEFSASDVVGALALRLSLHRVGVDRLRAAVDHDVAWRCEVAATGRKPLADADRRSRVADDDDLRGDEAATGICALTLTSPRTAAHGSSGEFDRRGRARVCLQAPV